MRVTGELRIWLIGRILPDHAPPRLQTDTLENEQTYLSPWKLY